MAGSLTIPHQFVNQSGNVAAAQLDDDFNAAALYVNARELTAGTLAQRPPPTVPGQWYRVTDVPVVCVSDGAAWIQVGTPMGAMGGFLWGGILENDDVSPLTVLNVSRCVCTGSDGATALALPAFSGRTTATWTVGSGQGKLDAGAIGANQWWHVFVIGSGDLAADLLFSLSPTTPALPVGYTNRRRIGSFKTDGANHILGFVQDGDWFQWKASVGEIVQANPGTAAFAVFLTVPTGLRLPALVNVWVDQSTAPLADNLYAYLSDLAVNDEAIFGDGVPLASTAVVPPGALGFQSGMALIRTNLTAQIRAKVSQSDANTRLHIRTLGWYDDRGKES